MVCAIVEKQTFTHMTKSVRTKPGRAFSPVCIASAMEARKAFSPRRLSTLWHNLDRKQREAEVLHFYRVADRLSPKIHADPPIFISLETI